MPCGRSLALDDQSTVPELDHSPEAPAVSNYIRS